MLRARRVAIAGDRALDGLAIRMVVSIDRERHSSRTEPPKQTDKVHHDLHDAHRMAFIRRATNSEETKSTSIGGQTLVALNHRPVWPVVGV